MTENQLREMYVNRAKTYNGIKEGSAQHHEIVDVYNTISPLPVGYRLTYTDSWCAGFTSAIAQMVGLTDIILPECSCTRMIKLYNNVGRWQEDESYTGIKPGDLVIYDWDDSGSGNNTGAPEHVGIITEVSGNTFTVIEGNKSDSVGYRTMSINGRYIRGFCLPDYASKAVSEDTSDAKKIWDYFMTRIGNEYGVAGLMGNLEAESGLHPDRVQGDIPYSSYSQEYTARVDSGAVSEYDFVHNGPGGGGYGLAQWTYYTRKQALYDMYKSGGYSSIGSLELAMDYLWHELSTSYTGVLSTLKTATSVREASDKVLHNFEKPADQSTAVEEMRSSMCQAWYDKYSGTSPGGGDDPVPGPPLPVPERKRMSLLLLLTATRRRL